eukprot:CAMPEP_0196652556 /NCGR_PEP_ID=MMETSP1086-20130531/1893_1 /TAXON_ID=77921 /ORGANISM="Cyanoptyche  gloeocystis , Strain SAG4.97" /LENGTH=124 /DNA_ID=CAMNT_0041983175 /DNA_START=78 /DNA_END=452 /DNA_ORIENTATION=+
MSLPVEANRQSERLPEEPEAGNVADPREPPAPPAPGPSEREILLEQENAILREATRQIPILQERIRLLQQQQEDKRKRPGILQAIWGTLVGTRVGGQSVRPYPVELRHLLSQETNTQQDHQKSE